MTIELGDPRVPKRFWDKIVVNEDGCWSWVGTTLHSGYGMFHLPEINVSARRYLYEMANGHEPPGVLTHGDANTSCVRLDHLKFGNHANRRWSYCKQGHPFDEANTGQKRSGQRYCIACSRIHSLARHRKVRAMRLEGEG